MKYTYTSSEANKALKGLTQKKQELLALEEKASLFTAALEENLEDIRPLCVILPVMEQVPVYCSGSHS